MLNLTRSALQPVSEENSITLGARSREQILSDLSVSREQIKNGEFIDFEEALAEIESQYDL